MMLDVPPLFAKATLGVHGDTGAQWLQDLPELLAECAARWALIVEAPFIPLSYNYVAPAVRGDGTQFVLKVGVPCRELSTEIAALRCYAGRGSVRLLDADDEKGVLLLERLLPGASLLSVGDDDEATKIAATVMQNLWRPAPIVSVFPTIADWATGLKRLRQRFSGSTGPLPTRLVEESESLFADLLSSQTDPVLLHGDLHHGNISRAERVPWLAIDPKGLVGELAFETSAVLLNSFPLPIAVLARRVAIFAETLDLPRGRICGWATARAVLSACWIMEDNGTGWEDAITVAGRLSSLNGSCA